MYDSGFAPAALSLRLKYIQIGRTGHVENISTIRFVEVHLTLLKNRFKADIGASLADRRPQGGNGTLARVKLTKERWSVFNPRPDGPPDFPRPDGGRVFKPPPVQLGS